MTIVFWPYKLGSASIKELKKVIRTKSVLPNGKYKPRREDMVINWGNSTSPTTWKFNPALDVNKPDSVRKAVNKLTTFQELQGKVNIPEWTTDKNEAANWITNNNATVVCRRTLAGNSGRGIVVSTSVDTLVDAPLYTKYQKKRHEFRVHVVFGKVIDISIKRKRRNTNVDTKIRSWDNGWVFCHDNVPVTQDLKAIATNAVTALGLDFGAVDVIWNERNNEYFVLEVNTAPGIEGQTVTKYKEAFENGK